MKHHLVDLYQVCSNYGPGTQNGSALGGGEGGGAQHMYRIDLYRENMKKIFLS